MLILNVLVLCCNCCVFVLYLMSYESEALIIYDPRSRYYSYNMARGGYGRYYDQEKIRIYSATSAEQPKKTSQKRLSKTKSLSPINLSFEPLGALKIDSLTHGEIEFNPEALDDVLYSMATGTASMVPDFYQYIPTLPRLSSLYEGDEPTEASGNQLSDESSRPRKHHRNSDQDNASEEHNRSSGDHNDESGHDDEEHNPSSGDHNDESGHDNESGKKDNSEISTNHNDHSKDKSDKSDYDKKSDDDEDNAAEERDDVSEDHSTSKHSRSSEQKNNSSKGDKNEPASGNKNSKHSSEHSKEKSKENVMPEIVPEVLIEELPPPTPAQEGYARKFVKYYSYAKPIAKVAMYFVPGLGQYKGVMFGIEMANLAYETATMYQNGDGYAAIGWHLGKEALKRLGRRSEPLEIAKVRNTSKKASSIDTETDEFLNQVKNTQYPTLDEAKEQKIKSSVTKIVRKYFYDLEEYKNKKRRTKFIDLMVSCVKFIALRLSSNT